MRQHAGEINPPGNRHRPASAMAAGPIRMIWKGGCIGNLERAKGFEPSTPTLARLCSTPELRPLGVLAGTTATAWQTVTRSEERRGGQEGGSTCRSRGWPDHKNKKKRQEQNTTL